MPTKTEPDLDGARAVMRALAQAREDERNARTARENYIVREYARGVTAARIAEGLREVADELNLDPIERSKLGVSEGSVHQALNRRSAKG